VRASRVAWYLGIAELSIGAALCFSGIRYGWAAGDSLSNVWGTVVIFTGVFGFVLPGGLLLRKPPTRWLSQLFTALATILASGVIAQALDLW